MKTYANGKSLGLIIKAIGECVNDPSKNIHIRYLNDDLAKMYYRTAERIVDSLLLRDFSVRLQFDTLSFKSCYYGFINEGSIGGKATINDYLPIRLIEYLDNSVEDEINRRKQMALKEMKTRQDNLYEVIREYYKIHEIKIVIL